MLATIAVFDLHIHSYYSDGEGSVEDIARKAKEKGLRIIALADHSIEHPLGLDEGKAKKRKEEIEYCQSKFDIKIFDAIECGIDADSMIVKPKHKFELVIASIHEVLPKKEYCKRIIECAKNCDFDILGHYRSSIFGTYEEGLDEMDMEVIDVLVENDIALEVNSAHRSPPIEIIEIASSKVMYSVGSDSHTLSRVGDVAWAFNTLNKKLKKWKSILNRRYDF